jgi:hypothetical protein
MLVSMPVLILSPSLDAGHAVQGANNTDVRHFEALWCNTG